MKIVFKTLLLLGFVVISQPRANAMDPKIKALISVAAYGTIGGALLGTASLAFGADKKMIAQGASLGLYAGLIFGGYIIYTHQQKNRPQMDSNSGEYPDDPASPYQEVEGGSVYDGEAEENAPKRWDAFSTLEELREKDIGERRDGLKKPERPIYIHLINWTF